MTRPGGHATGGSAPATHGPAEPSTGPAGEAEGLTAVGSPSAASTWLLDASKGAGDLHAEVHRLNRVLRTHRAVNSAMATAADEHAYLDEVCEALVTEGGFCLAWIGWREDDPEAAVRRVSCAGEAQGYLDGIRISWRDGPYGRGPTGLSIREDRTVTSRDFASDPIVAPWRDKALAHGIRSSAALPIRLAGEVVGALTIYSSEANAFSDAEVELLEELREDIGYALASIRDRAAAAHDLARQSAAMAQTSESILLTDADATIRYVNPAFERVTGYSAAEALGRNPRMLASGVHDDAFYRAMWATLAAGETWHGDIVNRRKDGALFTESASISPIRDTSGRVTAYVAVKRDVTAERELEAQLRQSQRLEAVGQLAGGIAHDMNNLLMAITGYAELARDELGDGHPAVADLDEVLNSTGRATTLVRQLLAFSRSQPIDRRPIDVPALIDGLAPMLRRLLGSHVVVALELEPAPGPVLADAGELQQVIVNLAVNARDAMSDGGGLTIRTGPTTLAGESAMRVVVTDTGVGMPPDVLEHIFDAFFTTKELGKGSGLGLAIVHRIVTAAGGQIAVESTPGAGTTFTIDLPCTSWPAASDASSEAGDVRGRGERVLVVEDDDAVRTFVARVLRTLGYDVTAADSGDAALPLLRARPFDLLLSDIRMPGMQGTALAREAASVSPGIAIVLMSGFAVGAERDLEGVTVSAILDKPVAAASLGRAVRAALDGG